MLGDLVTSGLMVPLVIGGAALALFLGLFAMVKRWTRVPPEKAAIIFGRKQRIRNEAGKVVRTRGFRIVKGGATFVWPVLEKITWLDLNVVQRPVKVTDTYSRDGVPVTVEAVANFKIAGNDAALEIAAEQFGGMHGEDVHSTIEETLQGHLRAIIGKLTPEEIYRDRQKFGQEVQEAAAPDLADMGFEIVTFPIKDVRDAQGYLDSLGKRRTAEVKKEAAIGEAEAKQEELEKTSQAIRLGQQAKFANEQKVAEAERDLKVLKAELRAQTEAKEAEADLAGQIASAGKEKELRQAQVQVEVTETESRIELQKREQERVQEELVATRIKPAEATKQATVIEAQGRRQAAIETAEGEAKAIERRADAERSRLQREGEGQAAAVKARLEAEAAGKKAGLLAGAEGQRAELLAIAEGEKAKLLAIAEGERAEAEAKERLAEAYRALDQAGIQQMILDKLPDIIAATGDALTRSLGPQGLGGSLEAMAKPLGQIDSVHVIDMGGSGSPSVNRFASVLPSLLFQLLSGGKALGFDAMLERLGLSSELLEKTGLGNLATLAEAATGRQDAGSAAMGTNEETGGVDEEEGTTVSA